MRDTADTDRLFAVLLGFAAGYVVGVLAAPDAGPRTRRRLRQGTREAASTVQHHAREAGQPLVARVRAHAQGLAERHVPLSEDWDVVDGKSLLKDLQGLPQR